MKKRKNNEATPKKTLIKKVVQSTQTQIPVKDIANGIVITEDERLIKILEINPIGFQNMKISQQNIIKAQFENFLKTAPNSFQIKSISEKADLEKQIQEVELNIANEDNSACQRLGREYRNNLEKTQNYTVERKFYISFENDEENNFRRTRKKDIDKEIYRLNSTASQLASSLGIMGNNAKNLNNVGIGQLFYKLLNRNTSRDVSFEQRYEKIYEKYINDGEDKDVYIPPCDLIAPDKIMLNDKKYIVADGKYYSFLYIANDGWIEQAWCGWIDMFINSQEGIDVDLFFRKKNKQVLKNKLRQTIGHTQSDLGSNYDSTTDSSYNASSKYYAASYLFSCLQNGQDIFDVSCLITVSGDSITDVNEKIENLFITAKEQDIKLRDLPYQEELAYISVLPLNYIHPAIEQKASRNMPCCSASTLYPFNTYQMIHDGGLYLADSLTSNSPIIPNFWNTSIFSNPHIFLCGTSGAGKTSFLELISTHARVMNIPIFIIAPEKQLDYKRLCDELGGQFVNLGSGSANRINIMDIPMLNDSNDKIYGKVENSALEQQIGIVIEFIHTAYQTMSPKDQAILNIALIETYRRAGITKDNNSLWADEKHTKYKKMPILSDLASVLKEQGQQAEDLYLTINYLTSGAGSFLNGQTNIDVTNKFFVIGIENNTKQTKQLSAYLSENFCQTKIREGRLNKSMFVIDEGWSMLDNPSIAQKMKEDSKILRGFGCCMIFATQQMGDVLNSEEGQAILKNSETRIIMKHKDEDIRYISQFIDLSESERKMIKGFQVGEALLIANENRIPIGANPSDFEKLLTFNDEKTLRRYAEYRDIKERKESEILAEQELIKNTVPISSLHRTSDYSRIVKHSQAVHQIMEEGGKKNG